MGLDMYAYAVKPTNERPKSVLPHAEMNGQYSKLFHQWRKHPNLHGFMEEIYRNEYNGDDDFNCKKIRLMPHHLDELEKAVKTGDLPKTEGFFFGESTGDKQQINDDLEFIKKARQVIDSGDSVYYDSWW